jgi:histidine phosphotransfer protein HptB
MSAQSIIDLATFEALKESMGADFISELLQVYYEETPQLLSKLQQALARQDCEAFRMAAHSIKSTSNSFGAMQLGVQAKELEMMGREQELYGAPEKVEALANSYQQVRETLEELTHHE